jgi:uncharacterized protein (TIGR02145 family)
MGLFNLYGRTRVVGIFMLALIGIALLALFSIVVFAQRKGSFTDSRDGKVYKTIKIGTQTWMAENLNYNASGSKCNGEDGFIDITGEKCKDDDIMPCEYIALPDTEVQSNCKIYGRLYSWATAMMLLDSCENRFCVSQMFSKHKGICPGGWHIPSTAEWDELINYVDSATAGAKLKAASGWASYNDTDEFGFAALPGCGGHYGNAKIVFCGVGYYGLWWSATEGSCSDCDSVPEWVILQTASEAYSYSIDWNFDRVGKLGEHSFKDGLKSVRCIKD